MHVLRPSTHDSFCSWARVDVVFIGAGRTLDNSEQVEKELADLGVTLYGPEVSQALIDGSVDFESCLRAPVESLKVELPKLIARNEQLIAEAKYRKRSEAK